jgi:thioredoxin-related protein
MKKFDRNCRIAATMLLALLLTVAVQGTGQATATISWYEFDEGMARGREEGKKIYINFYSDLCRYCEAMERETFVDPSVVSFLRENFIAIRVNSDREKKIAADFRVRGLPDSWFMAETGRVIGHRPGFIPPTMFFKILQSVQKADAE